MDVKFNNAEETPEIRATERAVWELGWGFCSTDSIVVGSVLVPFGLIFPYIGCRMGFKDSGKGSAELVLGIRDVKGDPLDCKCCDLEVLDLDPVREVTDTCSVFGHCAKIQIREVFTAGGDGVENLCGLFLLRASPVAGKGHLAGDLFTEKMVELLSVNKSEFTEGKPVWQLILSFLYRRSYWALVTVSGSDGSSHMGILKPFTINHAVLCFVGKDFIGSCGCTSVSVSIKSKDGGRRRSKVKDVSWSSFREAAFERFDGDGCGVDLEDVYFARECSKTKKFRFLKCWMKQIESSSSSRQIKPEELNMPLSVKEEEERVLDSPPELEEQLSLSSSFSGGSHLSGSMSEDVASFDCLDDPEAFLVSIPQKIETGLWSEEADLRNLAERLVGLSTFALHAKFSRSGAEGSDSVKEGEEASDANIAANVSCLLLKNPRDLISKYKGFNFLPLVADLSLNIPSMNNKIREHELQILFRMEILRSKIGAAIEENIRQKMIKEICSLLRSIEFDLQGESMHGESLLEFAGRTVKSRYSRSLGDIIHKIYSQMEFYSFDSDDIEASDPLLNSDSCDLKKDADDNDTKPPADAIGLAPGSFSSKKSTRPPETAVISEQDAESSREKQLLKAQEQRYKARRFSSFTSWIPDLQRVWALKLPRAERSSGESYPKKSRKRKRRITANDMVCETPMTGKRVSPIGRGDGFSESGQSLCRSLSKVLFADE